MKADRSSDAMATDRTRSPLERQLIRKAQDAYWPAWPRFARSIIDADIAGCTAAIADGAHVRQQIRDPAGWSSLHLAAISSHPDAPVMIDWLVDQGALIDGVESLGCRPLHLAVLHRRIANAQRLVERHADVNAGGLKNRTPLDDAIATRGAQDLAIWLIARGARLDRLDWRDPATTQLRLAGIATRVRRDATARAACLDHLVAAMTSSTPAAAWAAGVLARLPTDARPA